MKKIVLIVIIILIIGIPSILFFNKEENNIEEPISEEQINLNKLNNINEEITYFNYSYIDRYLEYKNNNPTSSIENIILHVNMNLDYNFYENIIPALNKNTNKVIVNKYYYLDENYIPDNLTTIKNDYSSKTIEITKETNDAFENLVEQAQKENLTIIAVSGYRDYTYQENLYNNYVAKDGVEQADTYSARPGHSEHQTGLAIDISNNELPYTSFNKTEEYIWMVDNAHKYGFILRYPENKENITGYFYEPWHYRYVGIDIATEIYNEDITYEEYYTKKIEEY